MIKIFSIKEIVDASEKLLATSNNKISRNLNLDYKEKKITDPPKSFEEPLILEKELEKTNEPANNQNLKIEKKQSSKVITNVENNSDRQEIINELLCCLIKKLKKVRLRLLLSNKKKLRN